jgi:transcriptional regulator with XRE-family HTH domain
VDVPITDPRKPLGQTIRNRREALGLTQEQLAERAGLHWTFISGVERGIRNISIMKLHRIAISLGVRLRDLVENCVLWLALDVGGIGSLRTAHIANRKCLLRVA